MKLSSHWFPSKTSQKGVPTLRDKGGAWLFLTVPENFSVKGKCQRVSCPPDFKIAGDKCERYRCATGQIFQNRKCYQVAKCPVTCFSKSWSKSSASAFCSVRRRQTRIGVIHGDLCSIALRVRDATHQYWIIGDAS